MNISDKFKVIAFGVFAASLGIVWHSLIVTIFGLSLIFLMNFVTEGK